MQLTDDESSMIMVTALEGGSNYWLIDHSVSVVRRTDGMPSRIVIDGVHIENLTNACNKLLSRPGCHQAKADIAASRDACDAESADVLLQLAAFDEVLYG